MKHLPYLIVALFCATAFPSLAQTDTIVEIEYDTVVVQQPPVVVQKKVLSVSKSKPEKEVLGGFSLGINYFTSRYYTCKECDYYAGYAKSVDSSQQGSFGFNATLYRYRNISRKLSYGLELRYSFLTEKFDTDSIKTTNYYQQIGLNANILYELIHSEKNRLYIGVGGHARYLISAQGKTLTIFKDSEIANINDFRIFNKFGGGVQVFLHYMKQLKPDLYLLIHPELAYDITSFTSYNEYYLQNRLIYSLNLG